MFSEERLRQYREENRCPKCDQVCQEMAMIWASGPLLGTQQDMDDIADAIVKVYENRDQLKKILDGRPPGYASAQHPETLRWSMTFYLEYFRECSKNRYNCSFDSSVGVWPLRLRHGHPVLEAQEAVDGDRVVEGLPPSGPVLGAAGDQEAAAGPSGRAARAGRGPTR